MYAVDQVEKELAGIVGASRIFTCCITYGRARVRLVNGLSV
jgi:hypothetical protein